MNQKTTAKDFFLYLGVMIGLYVSSVSFLVLVFQIINKTFPLSGEYAHFEEPMRNALAALIIFFPAFLYVLHLTHKDLKANPEKKDMWVRRWMIFLTLFIAGLTIAIDLTTLVYRFLSAEDMTLRFFLKVFFVLSVAITIFKFTFTDLKRTNFEVTKQIKISVGIISAIVLTAIIWGIAIIGSPAEQRARQLDDRRIGDLMTIQNQIVYSQWQNKGTVPDSLEDLEDPISNFIIPTDPETEESYGYKKLSKNSFELCATFKTISPEITDTVRAKPVTYYNGIDKNNENWQHQATTTCFTRVIDEKLYPINLSKKFID